MSGEGKLNVVGYGKLFVKPDYTKLIIAKYSGTKLKCISNIRYTDSASTPSFYRENVDYAPECYGESTPRFNPDDEEMERMIEVDWELE